MNSTNELYTDLSAYYDLMCADINYQEQSESAHRIHQVFGHGGRNYLDLACGTGPHVEHFIQWGYTSTGLDINQPMLTRAALRCPQASFSHQDMSHFIFEQRFNLITCFLYSIHYAYPTQKLHQTFVSAFNALHSGGVFCFDAVDKNTIANDDGFTHSLQHNDAHFNFQSRWFYPGEDEKLDLHIRIEKVTKHKTQDKTQDRNKDKIEQWRDTHTMTALTINSLREQLIGIGFEVTLLERDFTKLSPWNNTNGNVLVVCTKP